MSSILIVLLGVYVVLGSIALIAFVRAARRTNEDWEQHPAARQRDLALMQAEEQAAREAQAPISSASAPTERSAP